MKKVLIVDDSPLMAKLTKKNVESLGYAVEIRENSSRAVSYIGNNKADIILMDIELMGSRYDGIKTAKIIRKKYNIPIIFITGHEDIGIFEEANIETPFDVVLKPYNIKQLKMQMEVALYNNKTERKMLKLERMFEALMQLTSEMIIITDEKSLIIKMNRSAELFFGINANEYINCNLFDKFQFSLEKKKNSKAKIDLVNLKEIIESSEKGYRLNISDKTANKQKEMKIQELLDEDKKVDSCIILIR